MEWVWLQKEKQWKPRDQGFCLGRIYFAHPASGAHYYKEACSALGLLDGDTEWHEALQAASAWATAPQLRQLFVTLLIFCEVADPKEPDMSLVRQTSNRLLLEEQMQDTITLSEEASNLERKLNPEQSHVYDRILEAVRNNIGGFFFVYGSGGTEKTYLWSTLISRLRSEGKIVIAVASSGIAALLLQCGKTAHSRFKIPINLNEDSCCRIEQGSQLAHFLQMASLIIWDEAPMMHIHAFEAVDRALRDIIQQDTPEAAEKVFGGKTVVLGGDFRQILPVVPRKGREDIVKACIYRSQKISPHCTIYKLTTNMRLRRSSATIEYQELEAFSKWVLDVGDGKIPHRKGNFGA